MPDGPLKRFVREIHRRTLWQVLGIYVVASWLVLQVIETLDGMVTLPEWFAGLAIGFLVLGFPIVLATAFIQEGGPGRDAGDVEMAIEREFGEGGMATVYLAEDIKHELT